MATEPHLIEFIKSCWPATRRTPDPGLVREGPAGGHHYYGLDEYTPQGVHDTIVLMRDNDTVSFDRNWHRLRRRQGRRAWDGGKEGSLRRRGHHETVHVKDSHCGNF
ncbi:hypothetical protein HBB16_05825 [Pseudonocardia sp. MCCB 268]|nr:hypothetical protein [Pseudonocardia cytotoxica]